MSSRPPYSYDLSVKSDISDELINVYVMRPAAGLLVRALYRTSITPNQVTLAATGAGLCAAGLFFQGSPGAFIAAGTCITLKDLLDSADGQLARAKNVQDRRGRFLDSVGDFLVNLSMFAAIGYILTTTSGDIAFAFLAGLGFLGITLRVSYHVYYQTAFLHTQQRYASNRITEEIRGDDLQSDPRTLLLQRLFQALYGWQDRLMVRIDGWCRGASPARVDDRKWYTDRTGLRLSGFLGLGTELMLLTLCSLANRLGLYLLLNSVVMNSIWLVNIWYRRRSLVGRVT